ncbi:MAG: rRNA maturation RNase YbeY [Nitrospirae bacterium]|nr:rRNA maturation RNase YbeY [Nitrospirota bacterium]
MTAEVTNRQRKFKVDRQSIISNADKILLLCGSGNTEVSILIVNNEFMRTLNRQYRGIDKTTDVLSFLPAPVTFTYSGRLAEDGKPVRFLGDIVISMEKIYAQAAERGHSPDKEFKIMLIHGILHLLGYDHEVSRAEAQRMSRKEKLILSRL